MNGKVVSDSASNLLSLPGIPYSSVPLKIICGQKEYVDTPDLDVREMVEDLKRTKLSSSTSCPNVYDWLKAFGDAEEVFAVTITSALSGSYAAAVQAREDYLREHPQAKVCLVDSLSAGPGIALMVEKIKSLLLSGESFARVEKAIREYQKRVRLLFALQSMTNLARNGRVSPTVARIAGVLGIRLIGTASPQGTLQPLHKVRGEKRTLETMVEEMHKTCFDGGEVRIAHCFNPEGAQTLGEMITKEFPGSHVEIIPCTALCSYYAEMGGLMLGYAASC